jgi:hypothetical protein
MVPRERISASRPSAFEITSLGIGVGVGGSLVGATVEVLVGGGGGVSVGGAEGVAVAGGEAGDGALQAAKIRAIAKSAGIALFM